MILFNFAEYTYESKSVDNYVNLYLSKNFLDLFMKMNAKDRICQKFIGMLVDGSGLCNQKYDVSFIDTTDKDDTLSYITSNKAKPILDKFASINRTKEGINLCWISNRQEQRISRLINRLFGNEFTQKEVEDFVREYKAAFAGRTENKFELVKGEDVRRWYNGRNYSREGSGTLQQSCMASDERQPFFDIYVENPDKMNMLILKDPDGRIYGRANVWYLDQPAGKVFMDRIYTTYDWQIKLFIDYAIDHDWIFKTKQIYGGNVVPVVIDGKKEKIIMNVQLKPKAYDYYPYIDTLQFYNPKDGVLTNDVKKFHDHRYLTLVLANGDAYQDDGGTFKIDYIGRIVHEHFLRWSELDQVYIHQNDAIRLEYRDDYVTPEHEFVKLGRRVVLKEDAEPDPDKPGEYRLKNNF